MYAVESASAHQALVKHAEEARMWVGITISHPGIYDADNAVGAIKPVLDALRKYPRRFGDVARVVASAAVAFGCRRSNNHNRDRESKRTRSTVSETRQKAAASRCPARLGGPPAFQRPRCCYLIHCADG